MANEKTLGDRMKRYEMSTEQYLVRRVPTLIRLDGKAFTNWTSGLERPFDDNLHDCMEYAAYQLCDNVEGARFAYTQSDEITVFLVDYKDIKTEAWFDYRVQKMVSVSASICSTAFMVAAMKWLPDQLAKKGPPAFDARVYQVPKEEVCNAFLWRQRDATRNSIQSVGQAHFSHKELHRKNGNMIQEMLFSEKGVNWNDTPIRYKRGVTFYKVWLPKGDVKRPRWGKDFNIPIFSQEREYVEKWLQDEPPVFDYETPPGGFVPCDDIKLPISQGET